MAKLKNYKLLENRPELTPQQVKEGMNFDAINSNSSLLRRKIFMRRLRIAGISGVIVATFLFFFLRNNSEPERGATIPVATSNESHPIPDSVSTDTFTMHSTVDSPATNKTIIHNNISAGKKK